MLVPVLVFAAKDSKPTSIEAAPQQKTAPQTKTYAINVSGMTCGSCAEKVEAALMQLDGVTAVSVDHTSGRTIVMLKASSKVSQKDITAAIKDAGYDVRG